MPDAALVRLDCPRGGEWFAEELEFGVGRELLEQDAVTFCTRGIDMLAFVGMWNFRWMKL